MAPSKLQLRALEAIAPGLIALVDNLVFQVEAQHDLLCLGLPYNEETYQMAFENVRALEPELVAGNVTIQDRQSSLIEIYNRRAN